MSLFSCSNSTSLLFSVSSVPSWSLLAAPSFFLYDLAAVTVTHVIVTPVTVTVNK